MIQYHCKCQVIYGLSLISTVCSLWLIFLSDFSYFLFRLKSFATDWKQAQEEKHRRRRTELLSDRSVLIEKGAITSQMQSALRDIFNGYKLDADPRLGRSCELNQSEASRLWYRCGLKLSCLTEILQSQSERTDKSVAFADFLGIVSEIVEEDEKWFATTITPTEFQVGDRVELVEGYERFGDAINGPLVPGERGVIVELQQGPEGERYVHFWFSDIKQHKDGFEILTERCFTFTLHFQLI